MTPLRLRALTVSKPRFAACTLAAAFALAVAVVAPAASADGNAAPGSAAPTALPTLEPAPRLEMRAFRAYHRAGTASVTGTLLAPTRLFGPRRFLDPLVYLVPAVPYASYIVHIFRDSWLRNVPHPIDPGVQPYVVHLPAQNGSFTFSGLAGGTYDVFAGAAAGGATTVEACTAKYAGYDELGTVTDALVPLYCYGDAHRDLVFLAGTVTVAEAAHASVLLTVAGETTY